MFPAPLPLLHLPIPFLLFANQMPKRSHGATLHFRSSARSMKGPARPWSHFSRQEFFSVMAPYLIENFISCSRPSPSSDRPPLPPSDAIQHRFLPLRLRFRLSLVLLESNSTLSDLAAEFFTNTTV